MNTAPPTDFRIRWKAKIVELFGIDLRSLALFRMATALVMLYDIAMRFGDIRAMYSDQGVMTIAELQDLNALDAPSWRWSLHFLDGSVEYQWLLFAVAAVAASALLVGFYTRLATVLCWVFVVSLHMRAPLLVNGGDVMLCMMLFWGMFLPLGRRCSIDAIRRPAMGPSMTALSVASTAAMLQVCFVYFFTAIYKFNDAWLGGEAIYNALSYGRFVRPLGEYLLHFPLLLRLSTFATLWLELIGPLLFFVPWRTVYFRSALLAMFLLLHVGIELTLSVTIFSFMSMAALTVFVPAEFWESAAFRRFATWLIALRPRWFARHVGSSTDVKVQRSETLLDRGLGWMQNGLCLAMLVYSLVFCIATVIDREHYYSKMPTWMRLVTQATGAGQQWSMFEAPDGVDQWVVARARLRDGSEVNLLRDDSKVDLRLPRNFADAYPSRHWQLLCSTLIEPKGAIYRQGVALYLCRLWNQRHDQQRQVAELNLICLGESPPAREGREIELLAHIKHGPWILRHPNGAKAAEGTFVYGKEHGPWTHWAENGRRQGQGTYCNGQMHGRWKFWYENGRVSEVTYDRGNPVP